MLELALKPPLRPALWISYEPLLFDPLRCERTEILIAGRIVGNEYDTEFARLIRKCLIEKKRTNRECLTFLAGNGRIDHKQLQRLQRSKHVALAGGVRTIDHGGAKYCAIILV